MLGNPDIRPEKTVQYQFGYKQAVTEWLGVDLNVFYKDIRDLLGVEFIATYNDAEYARLTNVDFGNVIGFTVALEQRRSRPDQHLARLHLAAGRRGTRATRGRPPRAPRRARTRGPGRSPSTGTSATRST